MNSNIPVVIPAYEPTGSLIDLVNHLKAEGVEDIIIVDDGSGQEYRQLFYSAEKKGCIVLRHAVNLGKGRALKTAFNYILNEYSNAIGVVTADSDGQHRVRDIVSCADTLGVNPECLVLGVRDFSGNDIPWKSRFGNILTKKVCKFLTGVGVSDTQTGLRGIPRAFMIKLLDVPGERFDYETNMLIASRYGYRILEVPISTVYDSKTEHKTHFDPISDSVRIYLIFGKILIKFIISSLSAFAIDICLFSLFCFILSTDNVGYKVVIATVLARIISATYNFLVNYKTVFESDKDIRGAAVEYAILAIVIMSLSALLLFFTTQLLPMIHPTVIKLVVDTLLFLASYYIQRKFVF